VSFIDQLRDDMDVMLNDFGIEVVSATAGPFIAKPDYVASDMGDAIIYKLTAKTSDVDTIKAGDLVSIDGVEYEILAKQTDEYQRATYMNLSKRVSL